MKFREITSRLTGISSPIFGVSWNQAPPSRNARLMRRVRRIEQLPAEQPDAAIKILDAFLESRSS